MKKRTLWLATVIGVVEILATSVVAQTNDVALVVRGAVKQPLALSLADLGAMPHTKLKATEKGSDEATYEGVSLFEVVNRAQPMLTEKCCSNAINTVIIVKAADNYQAVFSMTELDPKFVEGEILLADRRDGQPLKSPQGPLEIIIPDEKVHARWVHQVNLIEVLPIGDRGTSAK